MPTFYPHFSSSAIILAAGFSNRMGQCKALLSFDKEKTFLEKIIEEYIKFGTSEIVVVINKTIENELINNAHFDEKVKFVINHKPEIGRWSSIITGLKELKNEGNCFIQNVDNPFVTSELLVDIDKNINADNYVVPVFKAKGGHPIIIGHEIIKNILTFDDTDRDLKEYLTKFKRTEVEVNDENILININTMEDYMKYFRR